MCGNDIYYDLLLTSHIPELNSKCIKFNRLQYLVQIQTPNIGVFPACVIGTEQASLMTCAIVVGWISQKL